MKDKGGRMGKDRERCWTGNNLKPVEGEKERSWAGRAPDFSVVLKRSQLGHRESLSRSCTLREP